MRRDTLARNLKLKEAIAIGIGGMIGGGIFSVIGLVVGLTGSYVFASLFFCTVAAIFTGYNYSLLARKYPSSGASYTYITQSFGKILGGVAGWILWFGYVAASALYAVTFGLYTSYFLGVDWKTLGLLLIVLFTTINIRGVKETGFVENIIVAGKVLILLIFIIFGLSYIGIVKFLNFNFSYPNGVSSVFDLTRNIIMGSALIFVAYEGFELIAASAEEIENPEKNIGIAIHVSIIIVSLIYIFTAMVSVMVVDPTLFSESEGPLIIAAKKFLGVIGEILMGVGSVLATASALNASLYGASRIMYAISRDGLAPSILNNIHSKRKTPHFSILFTSLASAILVVIGFLEDVASLASLFFMMIFMAVNLSVINLQKRGIIKNNLIISIIPIIFIGITIAYLLSYLMNILRMMVLLGALIVSISINFHYGRKQKMRTKKL
ncbi:MAG: amino acid permease [Candidatus Odinarchaeota archaeon]|nr:amino acid permease [Candidatus Odinarchaeota archaeon]